MKQKIISPLWSPVRFLSALTVLSIGASLPALAVEGDSSSNTSPFSGGAEGNLNLTTGNTDIKTYGATLFADYRAEVLTTRAKVNFMQNQTDGTERAKRLGASLRTGMNVTSNLDFFALGTFMHDNFSGIDRQWMVTPGLGIYAVNVPEASIRFEFGMGWLSEKYYTVFLGDRSLTVATGGVGIRLKLSNVADFTDDAIYIYPIKDTNDWRINNVAAITSAITEHVALKLSYTAEHRNLAIFLRDRNDTFTTASIVVKL
jgi:putative salt-induced outer membrane protein YdiY